MGTIMKDIQHSLTKAEREAKRAERLAKAGADRMEKIANLPETVHGAPVVEIEYTAKSKQEIKELRRAFNAARKEFLKDLGKNNADQLRQLGMSENNINLIRNGRAPSGYNVHHKIPLAGGGKNEMNNFVFIKNEPYHVDFHKVTDMQIAGMKSGETKKVKIPVPKGNIFVQPAKETDRKVINLVALKIASNVR